MQHHDNSHEFVDIHCHLLPGIDDGAKDMPTSLEMAQLAVDSGIRTIVCTPHQLGNFSQNHGDEIRHRVGVLQREINNAGILLRVLPGGDVRIEDNLVDRIESGEVLTLADHGRHILLELPHELYFPIGGLIDDLARRNIRGILSHPERNAGIARDRDIMPELVEGGCLLQVTAGSLMGAFGTPTQALAEWCVKEGLCHFLATDAHGVRSRRPRLHQAYLRAVELVGEEAAREMCVRNPLRVAVGTEVPIGRLSTRTAKKTGFFGWLSRKQAA